MATFVGLRDYLQIFTGDVGAAELLRGAVRPQHHLDGPGGQRTIRAGHGRGPGAERKIPGPDPVPHADDAAHRRSHRDHGADLAVDV